MSLVGRLRFFGNHVCWVRREFQAHIQNLNVPMFGMVGSLIRRQQVYPHTQSQGTLASGIEAVAFERDAAVDMGTVVVAAGTDAHEVEHKSETALIEPLQ